MKKLYPTIVTLLACLLIAPNLSAQKKGPSNDEPQKEIKTVNGCDYEVVPGLAKVTAIELRTPKEESILKYNEYDVWFTFEPMEGDELIEPIQDTEIEFVLRSGNMRIPVGPEYLEEFRIKKGTRYAMELLQTRNRDACTELYLYESKALRNDLFEADRGDNLYNYKKKAFIKQQRQREREFQERKEKAQEEDNTTADPTPATTDPLEDPTSLEDAPDYSNLTEEELRKLAEEELRKELEDGNLPTDPEAAELGIDEEKIRKEMEEKLRKEYEDDFQEIDNESGSVSPDEEDSNKAAKDAIKEAKRKAKELEKKKREEERRQRQMEEERERKEEELRKKYEEELRKKMEQELRAKEEAAKKAKEEEERRKREEMERKKRALEKKNEIKKELLERIANETKRKECVFGERISGTIEVFKVSKVKEAGESHLGHTEYEVLVTFRPDNFGELSKREKKEWEAPFVFNLDPTGKNANPGAGYIRKYKVFKASQYKGFAQRKSTGICNDIMVYSPDLPNDESKINLK